MAACNAKWGYGNPLRELASRQYAHNTRVVPKITVKGIRAEGTPATINPSIRKNEEKVVDNVPIAELSKPITPYCRCWRSQTFPLCDGSHVKHNKATGDNVGPLLLKK
uniref:Iron-binding zinc finger CDGSH type domain-containing protein n=1 Tax=Picea sitchensis TaxID=3332 RepID=A9NJY3_PICSI|nr:unknown [Picea sitchensis]